MPTKEKTEETTTTAGISAADWGEVNGKKVQLFTLTNDAGSEVKITNYGGIVTKWDFPDKNGKVSSIVLGFDSLKTYLAGHPFFGAIAGRYANRIAKGQFTIDGETYTLVKNNGENHLHGGTKGFDKQIWTAKAVDGDEPSLELSYLSVDGEEGYPGNLNVKVVYTLTANNELKIDYTATTDKATVLNLTNHSYFNLTGTPANTILDHTMRIKAEKYTPVDAGLIPTGELAPVAGTPFDFGPPMKIGSRIADTGGDPYGYDHNFVIDGEPGKLRPGAIATDSISGRRLDMATTQPGVQFYTGNFLNGNVKSDDGIPYSRNTGFCLETQHFPDSPNKPDFPSALLKPGETYHETTVYKISLME
ncbi:MAG: aldose epimerase family protein [Imperialibacter sp.]